MAAPSTRDQHDGRCTEDDGDAQLAAAAEAAISDALQAIEQQRSHSGNAPTDVGLRLFPTQSGDFIRVLDRHEAPLSPGMLDAIHAFFASEQERAPHSRTDECPPECSHEPSPDAFTASTDADSGVRLQQPRDQSAHPINAPSLTPGSNSPAAAAALERSEAEETAAAEIHGAAELLSSEAASAAAAGSGSKAPVSAHASESTGEWSVDSAPSVDEVVAKGELMSLLFGSELENGEDDGVVMADERARSSRSDSVATTATIATEADTSGSSGELPVASPLEDFAALCEHWPTELAARRSVKYLPAPDVAAYYARTRTAPPCVVYWMRTALRAAHGNFALETALYLAQRLGIAVVTICLVPSAVVYPACHAASAHDAFARWSFADVRQQFDQAGLPFVGVTGSTAPKKTQPTVSPDADGFPLFRLLDAFAPYVVVTDDSWDWSATRDVEQLAQFLGATPSSSPWGLVTIDSDSCLPIQSRLAVVERSLAPGEPFVGEDVFSSAYNECVQSSHGSEAYAFTSIETAARALSKPEAPVPKREAFARLLRELELEEVDWCVVDALNRQSSPEMAPFGEMDALQKLDRLLAESNDQPAIQAELQGKGVLSLLPFIRHGSLFAGHVIHQITSTIASALPCRTPHERKRVASLKVMRSRALAHLGRERDYALYLALWTATQHRHRSAASQAQGAPLRFARCYALEALSSFALRSSLDAHSAVLPSWISPNTKFGLELPRTSGDDTDGSTVFGCAAYDPYELESARTDDLYWNDIQKFLMEHRYLHPLLVVYWSYRILQWSLSSTAAIATIESLLSKCALGATTSPDAVFTVWSQLFRLGKDASHLHPPSSAVRELSPRALQAIMDEEVASQPKLKLQS